MGIKFFDLDDLVDNLVNNHIKRQCFIKQQVLHDMGDRSYNEGLMKH